MAGHTTVVTYIDLVYYIAILPSLFSLIVQDCVLGLGKISPTKRDKDG